jgi:urea transporter
MRAVDALHQLITPPPDAVRLRTATLAASTATDCTITLAGASVSEVPYLASYTPGVGDVVLVLQTTAGVLIVLGKTT